MLISTKTYFGTIHKVTITSLSTPQGPWILNLPTEKSLGCPLKGLQSRLYLIL